MDDEPRNSSPITYPQISTPIVPSIFHLQREYQDEPQHQQSLYDTRRMAIISEYHKVDVENPQLVSETSANEGDAMLFCRYRLVEVMRELGNDASSLQTAVTQVVEEFQSKDLEWEDVEFADLVCQLDPSSLWNDEDEDEEVVGGDDLPHSKSATSSDEEVTGMLNESSDSDGSLLTPSSTTPVIPATQSVTTTLQPVTTFPGHFATGWNSRVCIAIRGWLVDGFWNSYLLRLLRRLMLGVIIWLCKLGFTFFVLRFIWIVLRDLFWTLLWYSLSFFLGRFSDWQWAFWIRDVLTTWVGGLTTYTTSLASTADWYYFLTAQPYPSVHLPILHSYLPTTRWWTATDDPGEDRNITKYLPPPSTDQVATVVDSTIQLSRLSLAMLPLSSILEYTRQSLIEARARVAISGFKYQLELTDAIESLLDNTKGMGETVDIYDAKMRATLNEISVNLNVARESMPAAAATRTALWGGYRLMLVALHYALLLVILAWALSMKNQAPYHRYHHHHRLLYIAPVCVSSTLLFTTCHLHPSVTTSTVCQQVRAVWDPFAPQYRDDAVIPTTLHELFLTLDHRLTPLLETAQKGLRESHAVEESFATLRKFLLLTERDVHVGKLVLGAVRILGCSRNPHRDRDHRLHRTRLGSPHLDIPRCSTNIATVRRHLRTENMARHEGWPFTHMHGDLACRLPRTTTCKGVAMLGAEPRDGLESTDPAYCYATRGQAEDPPTVQGVPSR